MNNTTRAVLNINYGTKRSHPADPLDSLREDILGTGVTATVATMSDYDAKTGKATVIAELVSPDTLKGDPKQVVQDALDKKYGATKEPIELKAGDEIEDKNGQKYTVKGDLVKSDDKTDPANAPVPSLRVVAEPQEKNEQPEGSTTDPETDGTNQPIDNETENNNH